MTSTGSKERLVLRTEEVEEKASITGLSSDYVEHKYSSRVQQRHENGAIVTIM